MAEMAGRCAFASLRFRWIYVTSVALVLLFGIQETLSARGARIGGGYRSSSSRYNVRTSSNVRYVTHSTRVRVRYNSYNRPWRSWHSYGSTGHIYGYVYYTRSNRYHSHRDREPTICRNEYDNLMDNGTNYEWFICPNVTSPDNYDACCGDEDRQHCCQGGLDGVRVFGIFVGLFIFLLSIILIIYCCCCRKPLGRETYFKQRFMSKHLTNQVPTGAAVHYRPNATGTSGNASEITHLMNPPVQGPLPTFPQNEQLSYPPMPPPSTQAMYPPQPVSNPSGYTNGSYPPSGGFAACAPYPSNPGAPPYPASDQPLYPVQPPLSGGPGYPASASAPPCPPYATDGSSAPPYPPYPTDGSSAPPYPPYPTDGSSAPPYPPYPTDGSSAPPYPPYPTDGSSAPPYPPQPAAYNPPGHPGSPPPTYSSLN